MTTNVTVTGTTTTVTDNGDTVVVSVAAGSVWGTISGTLANQADLEVALAGKLTTPGAWTSYSPTLGGSGTAVGNGTLTAAYTQLGKLVVVRIKFYAGTTTTIGAWLTLTLPVTAVSAMSDTVTHCRATDASVANYEILAIIESTTTMTLRSTNYADISTSNPFAWGNGDSFVLLMTYEAA